MIGAIAHSTNDQSTSVREIAAAISHIDSGTQKNAAMAEQAKGVSTGLLHEAEVPAKLVSHFRVGETDRTQFTARVA